MSGIETLYKYVNLSQTGDSKDTGSLLNMRQQRTQTIVDQGMYLHSIDRWDVRGIKLPVIQAPIEVSDLQLTVQEVADPSNFSVQSVDLSARPYYYNLQDLVDAFNTALELACTATSVSGADVPVLSFDGRLFSITSNSNFRSDFTLGFNELLTRWLHTFRFNTDETVLLESDVENQYNSSIDMIDPVNVVQIQTTSIPLQVELVPPPAGTTIASGTRDVVSIVTDFKVQPLDGSPYRNIIYNASANHRYSQLDNTQGSLKIVDYQFYWIDYRGNRQQIRLPYQATVHIKILLKKI